MVYLDSAATSHKKPTLVSEAVFRFLQESGANPGRAGHHLANRNAMLLYEAREMIASFFNASDPLSVVFTSGVTTSLNILLKGYLHAGDEVLVSPLEHNAMMRPLRTLEKSGVKVTTLEAGPHGVITEASLEKAYSSKTKLVAVNHMSNVSGLIQPIETVGSWCREKGITFLVDVAQSAGVIPVDMQKCCIDMLAFTGHKGMLGPMGVGGFVLGDRIDPESITPLIEGGTGSNSEEEEQPLFMPDRFESGTPNLPGVVGLKEGISYIEGLTIEKVQAKERALIEELLRGLSSIPSVSIVGHDRQSAYGPVLSFTIDDKDLGDVATLLDMEYGICCRAGLHCAPSSHRFLGTFPTGTIRFSVSTFTTSEEIQHTLTAIREIVLGKDVVKSRWQNGC